MRSISFGFLGALLLASHAALANAPAVETSATQAIVVDAQTGAVLFNKAADEKMYPSSMSKLMTSYVAFKHLKEGRVKLTDTFKVSEKAWRMGGSKMFIQVGTDVSLEDLLKGMIVQSGNDACVAIAEALSGSEEAFAAELNSVAQELGLKGSHFVNASGWPDENHYMTAQDLVTLSQALIRDFPEYYHYYAEKEFTYNDIKQGNRNPLLYKDLGVDGLKTGHTDIAGYGVAVSGVNEADGRRIILVINGTDSMQARSDEAGKLLTYAYKNFHNEALVKEGDVVGEAEVWLGQAPKVQLVAGSSVVSTVANTEAAAKQDAALKLQEPVQAPISKGQVLGTLTLPNGAVVEAKAATDVAELGMFERILPQINHLIFGKK